MTQPPAPTQRPVARIALLACALLLAVHALLSFLAVRSKSPVYDEPLHALGAFLHLHDHDFRLNPEDPPLWHYWAALPHPRSALKVATDSELYAAILQDIRFEWEFTCETLYPCGRSLPFNSPDCPDSDAFIMRSRVMMLILSVVLGSLVGWWSWRLGGPMAAVAATLLYALCPNFLGHGPLVKNDVPFTLVTFALAIAVWRAGTRLTVWNALSIGLLCAAALCVKYSGTVLGPIVAMLLIARALLPAPWRCFGRDLTTIAKRLGVSIAVIIAAMLISWIGLWAVYGFRFSPTPDPNARLNLQQMLHYTAMNQLIGENEGKYPTSQQVAAWKPNAFSRMIVFLEGNHLLPQAWLIGFLYTYQSALARPGFLLGEYSMLGWWYYFPLTMLFKTPLATLASVALAITTFMLLRRRNIKMAIPHGRWTWLCLLVPPALYLIVAMRSNLNLGIRHVLPVYPFVFVIVAIAFASARASWQRPSRFIAIAAALGLAVESLASFPNYIAFFNAGVGGSRGAINLVGDSNLDWGQDLKLMAQWQQEHPNTPLYLTYFGFADPWAYGISYRNFLHGYKFGPVFEGGNEPGVLAISATHLQAIYFERPEIRQFLTRLRQIPPMEVLGGTIYLYPWPPPVPVPISVMMQTPPRKGP